MLWGVDKETKWLSDLLSTIQVVLELAELKTRQFRIGCESRYKVDDILDECATKSSQLESEKVHFDRFSASNILFCCNIGNRMRDIRERLDEIAQISFELGSCSFR